MSRGVGVSGARAAGAAAFLLLALIGSTAAGAADFSPGGPPRALDGAPGIYEWRFQAARGPSPFDRIRLHRIALGPKPQQEAKAVLLYLPGTNMNGEVAVDDPRYNLVVYLAEKGIDAWSLDYRTHFIPPQTSQNELAELKEWGSELFESDIDAAAAFMAAQTHRDKLFLAGFSRGVEFAYLYAAHDPGRVAGLVMLDGFIPKHPVVNPRTPSLFADDIGGRHLTYEKRKALMELVIRNPDAPAPILKYRTARENLEHVVYDSPGFGGNGGLANPQGGFSDPVILARVLVLYDRYWPSVQSYENPFTPELRDALQRSKIPVIAFSSTNIAGRWPEMVHEAASSTGSTDVTFKELKGWGHLDVLCGIKAESEVYAPVAAWITRHVK